MADLDPAQEEGIPRETQSEKAEENLSVMEMEQKVSSHTKVEAKRSSTSKSSGSRKLSIAKEVESQNSLKEVKSKSSKDGEKDITILQEAGETTQSTVDEIEGATDKTAEGKEVDAQEVKTEEEFEEVEEEYEEEVEEEGEVKVVTKTRTVKVPKPVSRPKVTISVPDEEEEIQEEYEEEIEEDGEVKYVIKTRTVKMAKSEVQRRQSVFVFEEDEDEGQYEEFEEEVTDETGEVRVEKRRRKICSFEEKEEEYETEEEDENGEIVMVKKTRIIRVPLTRRATVFKFAEYEDTIEQYEEEVVNEAGEKVVLKQKRVVKILKSDSIKEKGVEKEEPGEGSTKRESEEGGEEGEEGEEGKEEDKEELEEDEEVEEGEEVVEDVEAETGEEGEEKLEKERRGRTDNVEELEGEEFGAGETKKKKKTKIKKKKLVEGAESVKSIKSTKSWKSAKSGESGKSGKSEKSEESTKSELKGEEDGEEGEEGEVEEEGEEEDEHAKSLTSEELRLAEEKALMAQHFESLMKLKTEYQVLRKRTLFLMSKLIQYFKKQKMDHLFTDVRDDPEAEQRFHRKLAEFHDCNQRMAEEKARINTQWEAQRAVNEELNAEVKQKFEELSILKREVAAKLIDSRTGRTVQVDKAMEDLLTRQEQQMKQLSEYRLVKIKLRRRIDAKRAEGQMDHSGGEFRIMDYEKLESLKEYYTDKITERDIEIGEVKNKIEVMEDNLISIRDQLKRREKEMEQEQMKLHLITSDLNARREHLNRIKTTKHKTERNTVRIKQQTGLLAYPTLLKDYEEKSRQLEELKTQTDQLKQQYRNGLERIRKLKEAVKRRTEAKNSMKSSTSSA